jgi:hypothetical protein
LQSAASARAASSCDTEAQRQWESKSLTTLRTGGAKRGRGGELKDSPEGTVLLVRELSKGERRRPSEDDSVCAKGNGAKGDACARVSEGEAGEAGKAGSPTSARRLSAF